jgi:hypothetical protein
VNTISCRFSLYWTRLFVSKPILPVLLSSHVLLFYSLQFLKIGYGSYYTSLHFSTCTSIVSPFIFRCYIGLVCVLGVVLRNKKINSTVRWVTSKKGGSRYWLWFTTKFGPGFSLHPRAVTRGRGKQYSSWANAPNSRPLHPLLNSFMQDLRFQFLKTWCTVPFALPYMLIYSPYEPKARLRTSTSGFKFFIHCFITAFWLQWSVC